MACEECGRSVDWKFRSRLCQRRLQLGSLDSRSYVLSANRVRLRQIRRIGLARNIATYLRKFALLRNHLWLLDGLLLSNDPLLGEVLGPAVILCLAVALCSILAVILRSRVVLGLCVVHSFGRTFCLVPSLSLGVLFGTRTELFSSSPSFGWCFSLISAF